MGLTVSEREELPPNATPGSKSTEIKTPRNASDGLACALEVGAYTEIVGASEGTGAAAPSAGVARRIGGAPCHIQQTLPARIRRSAN